MYPETKVDKKLERTQFFPNFETQLAAMDQFQNGFIEPQTLGSLKDCDVPGALLPTAFASIFFDLELRGLCSQIAWPRRKSNQT